MSEKQNAHLYPLSPIINGEVIDRQHNEIALEHLQSIGPGNLFVQDKTRTLGTEKEYQRRWAFILNSIEFHSEDMIYEWFLSARSKYSPSSFRKYKAAATWAGAVHEDLVRRIKPLNSTMKRGDGSPKKTSAKKRKSIGEDDFALLSLKLSEQRSIITRSTLLFCQASLMSGLRPSEWASAHISNGQLTLSNGKNSNGRASGDTRSLALSSNSEIAKKQHDMLSEFIDLVPRTGAKDFENFMKCIYRCLRRTSTQLFGPHKAVCLYTLRHQYSANMKRRNGKETVALAMGHRSEDTAGQHYARATQAWKDSAFVMESTLIEAPEQSLLDDSQR